MVYLLRYAHGFVVDCFVIPLHNEVVGGGGEYIGFTPSVRLSIWPSRI